MTLVRPLAWDAWGRAWALVVLAHPLLAGLPVLGRWFAGAMESRRRRDGDARLARAGLDQLSWHGFSRRV